MADPTVSVIVPVHNGGDDLVRCLEAISRSAWRPLECIVVDDASTEVHTAETAQRFGARLLRQPRQRGPAAARNAGAAAAAGDILFFTDADVVLHEDAIGRAAHELARSPGVAAAFGSYDANPGDASLISRYRNLYHHWNHQRGAEEASTFWSGCGAVRRQVFQAAGGFSESFARPSIEDIELGYRLRAAGHRIRLLKDMQGTHLKRWTLRNMVHTDIFLRGAPWVELLQRFPDVPADLNLGWRSRLATGLTGLLVLTLLALAWQRPGATLPFAALLTACLLGAALASGRGRATPDERPGRPSGERLGVARRLTGLLAVTLAVALPVLTAWFEPDPWALLPLLLVLAVAALQFDFYRLLTRLHGLAFALAVLPLQLLFFLGCGLSVPLGLARHATRAKPKA
ncbi:MAG: glycosyltransferase family 2 protein [Lysobacterales bacterium]